MPRRWCASRRAALSTGPGWTAWSISSNEEISHLLHPSLHPFPRVAENAHPGRVLRAPVRRPRKLHVAEDPFRVRHHDGEAAVGRGEPGDAPRRAARIVGVGFGDVSAVVDITHRHPGLLNEISWILGTAFAVGGDYRHAAAGHAVEEERRARRDLDHHQAPFELLRAVPHECRPMLGARDQLLQRRHHLAAVAGAERERIAAREELLELGPDPGVEQDRAGPAAAGAQHVAVGKPAAGGKALEPRQRGAAGDEVGHVDVHRLEAGAVERRRHLDMAVYALLPKNCDTGANAGRRSEASLLKSQMTREARILGIDDAVELLPRAFRVVAQRLHAPRGLAPGALHVVALVRVELLAVAPDENLVSRVELA